MIYLNELKSLAGVGVAELSNVVKLSYCKVL